MIDNIYYSDLFDIYGEFLPEKQRKYFEDYYFENLLLDEISENESVSKNAISKEIIKAKKSLEAYEEKLSIYKRREALKKEFENEEDILKRLSKYDNI